jgi:phosphinothricin acetyltransferase
MDIKLKPLKQKDWTSVVEIYRQGIETGNATFQKEVPNWESWDSGHLNTCRIVASFDNKIIGWAALAPVSGRCVYSGVAEVSIIVASKNKGQKIGTKLLERRSKIVGTA